MLLATMNVNTSPYALVAYSTILGLGSGMMYTVFTISVQNAFSLREIGVITAAMQFFRNVGSTVAIPIFGYIANYTMASSAAVHLSQKEILAISIQNVFLASIILAFIALIIAFFLKEISLGEDESIEQEKNSRSSRESEINIIYSLFIL